MNRIIPLLLLLVIAFTSCSVYEEVTFRDDGSLFYKFTIDAGEMLAAVGSTPSEDIIASGETTSLAETIRDSISDITPEMEADLQNIAPFYVSYLEDAENKVADMSYFGEFESADKYNKAITSLINLTQLDMFAFDSIALTYLLARNRFSWDGKTMTRRTENPPSEPEEPCEEGEEEEDEDLPEWSDFFDSGKMVVKYRFPREVDTATNSEALLTIDKRTVVLNPPASTFFKPDTLLNITVRVRN